MKCINCNNAGKCLDHKEQPSLIGRTSGIPQRKKQTNADRIHSMNIEELAEFLPIVSDFMCKPTDKCMENIFNHGECEKRKECALKWLQSEVEE